MSQTLHVVRCRLGRERLCCRQHFARDLGLGNRTFFDRPNRLTGFTVEHVGEGLFGYLCQNRNGTTILLYVQQYRSGGSVIVPDVLVDQLEVPLALTGRSEEHTSELQSREN